METTEGHKKTKASTSFQEENSPSSLAKNNFYNQDLEDVRARISRFWDEKKKVFKDASGSYYTEASSKCELPMARVKKIMKIDFDMEGQMIAQDAPLFLSKAAELFIEEITLKAWANTEEQRRKTLQKNDITAACSRNEHFDFLIDIVPREEIKKTSGPNNWSGAQPPQGAQVVAVSDTGDLQYFIPEGHVDGQPLTFQLENGQYVTATEIREPVQGRLVMGNSIEQDDGLSGEPTNSSHMLMVSTNNDFS